MYFAKPTKQRLVRYGIGPGAPKSAAAFLPLHLVFRIRETEHYE